jgi:hypothetical protein
MSRQSRSFRGFVVFHGVIGKSVRAGKALELEGGENEMGVDAEHVVVFVEGDLFHRRGGNFPRLASSAPLMRLTLDHLL